MTRLFSRLCSAGGVVYSIGEQLSVLTDVFPRDGDLEVLIEDECGNHEISVVWFTNVYILKEDIADVGLERGSGSMDQSP